MQSIPARALFMACFHGDAAAVSRLLPAGGTPLDLSGPRFQHPDHQKSTPLIVAAEGGHTDIVRMILERAPKTAVDYKDVIHASALLMAALYHRADTIRVLVDRGANVNLVGQQRATPLRCAVGPTNPGETARLPDPDGERQVAVVVALLRLDAGSSPPHPAHTPYAHPPPS